MPFRKKKEEQPAVEEQADILAVQREMKMTALENANAQRQQHIEQRKERIAAERESQAEENWVPTFRELRTPCFLIDYQANRSGDIIIKIRVPFRYRNLAKPMQEAYNQPLEAHFYKFSKAEHERSRIDELFANRQTSTVSLDQLGIDGTSTVGSARTHPTTADD
jgi:hypothetical protein